MGKVLVSALTLPSSIDVMDYFYGPRTDIAAIFRSRSCVSVSKRGGKNLQRGDMVWQANASDPRPCLWGNMAPGKLVTIIAFLRALGVTHVVESGRMGGLSAFHYAQLGFNVTSVELLPVPGVERALRRAVPGMRFLNGDGVRLVPEAVDRILAQAPDARVAVILDGPKGSLAVSMARASLLSRGVSAVLFDDQAVSVRSWPLPLAYSSDPQLRAALPMERDAFAHAQQPGTMEYELPLYFPEKDVITLALGPAWKKGPSASGCRFEDTKC